MQFPLSSILSDCETISFPSHSGIRVPNEHGGQAFVSFIHEQCTQSRHVCTVCLSFFLPLSRPFSSLSLSVYLLYKHTYVPNTLVTPKLQIYCFIHTAKLKIQIIGIFFKGNMFFQCFLRLNSMFL